MRFWLLGCGLISIGGFALVAVGCGDSGCDFGDCAGAAADGDAGDASSPLDATGDVAVLPEAGKSDTGPDADADAGPTCSATQILCNGQCVDPNSGAHCGSCSNICSGPTPNCQPPAADGGGAYICVPNCGGASPDLCGSSCTNVNTDPQNCKACGTVCASHPNAKTTCTGGTCGFQCNAGFHDCSGVCSDNMSTSSCGTSCTPCPAPANNGTASCSPAGACGINCNPNFHVCGQSCLSDSDEPSAADQCVIADKFGVFVSSTKGSDATGNGTSANPFQTITKGMVSAHTAGKRLYVCAGNYPEHLAVDSTLDGIQVYGGLDCSNLSAWMYSGSAAVVAPAPMHLR